MLDEKLYSDHLHYVTHSVHDKNYDPNKPRIRDLLWKHLDWLTEMDNTGKARSVVLDNVHKTLLCNTSYLGYDVFECPNCGEENFLFRHCHSRFCTSCGVKKQNTGLRLKE